MPDAAPDPYVEAHLVEELATDPRVGELGLGVHLNGPVVVLEGIVPTAERRDAAEAVVRERLPDLQIDNRIVVENLAPGGEPEVLA
jgi:hypothetical protein